MTISDRFVLFLREAGISQKDFSEQTGYLRQSLSKFLTGTTKLPKIDLVIVLLQHFPRLNIRWLLLGEGSMWLEEQQTSTDQAALLAALEQENQNLRKELLAAKDEIIELLKRQSN